MHRKVTLLMVVLFFFDQAPSDYSQVNLQYPPFENVERSYEDAMVTTLEEENITDFSNFVFGSETSVAEYDEAKACEERIQKIEKTLKQECEKSADSFFNVVLWGAYFKLKGQNTTNFDYEDLKSVLGMDFVEKLTKVKADIVLDINLDTFERKMYMVNDLLYEKNLFLCLYEKKLKFRYLFKKGHDKNKFSLIRLM